MTYNTQPGEACSGSVTVIMTVKDDAAGCKTTLDSLLQQSKPHTELIVVDGGSTDCTLDLLREYAARHPSIKVIQAPGANIARGRNLATSAASGSIIASIDSGCRARSNWLSELTKPFGDDPAIDFVAGLYEIDPWSLLEAVVGLATMRGQLDAVDPATFNPSGRSMAYTKELWKSAGGWPEWLHFSEDTLFAHKLRAISKGRFVASDAIVDWRPRTSLRSIARQFYRYGTGRGHTQIDATSFHYNLRNLCIVLLTGCLFLLTSFAILPLLLLMAYFYVVTFHRKAVRIAKRTGRWTAYPLTFVVMWVVLAANLGGYLVGSWQRVRDPQRYRDTMERFLQTPQPHVV